jgi:arabinan endo-1,5-alpha-L-arabinosidase
LNGTGRLGLIVVCLAWQIGCTTNSGVVVSSGGSSGQDAGGLGGIGVGSGGTSGSGGSPAGSGGGTFPGTGGAGTGGVGGTGGTGGVAGSSATAGVAGRAAGGVLGTGVGAAGTAGSAAGGIGGGSGGAASGTGGGAGQGGRGGLAGLGGGSARGGSAGVSSLGTVACGQTWTNPAKGDTWTHDPTLAREGNVYYLYYTRAPDTGLRVPFETSTDGVTWKKSGAVFPADLPWWSTDIPIPEIWGPDVHKINGTYYVYYSVSAWGNFNSSIGLATNTTLDPSNSNYRWVDRGKVIDFRNGGSGVNVIDPDLFVDDDGSFWLVYGSFKSGIRLVQLDPGTGKLLKDPPDLTVITNSLGEGSSLIKHNGFYYVMVSRGTCCAQLASTYQVVMGRSATLKGPYLTKDNKRMLDGAYTLLLAGDTNHPGQGGQSFYEENGQLYMVYHAYTAPSGDPVVNVRPVFFDKMDWPTLDPCLSGK